MDDRTQGPRLSGRGAAGDRGDMDAGYRGQRLGLPERGPGAIAGFGRRMVAITLDWLICLAIAGGLLGGGSWSTLGVFAVENILLVGTLGYTIGHGLTGLRVARLAMPSTGPLTASSTGSSTGSVTGASTERSADSVVLAAGPPSPTGVLVRTLLLCLAIPALVWDSDGRGLHDKTAGTVVVRRR